MFRIVGYCILALLPLSAQLLDDLGHKVGVSPRTQSIASVEVDVQERNSFFT